MPASNIENALIELNQLLADHPIAKLAFTQLTPVRKQEFIKYIAEAKKPEDRKRRIMKSVEKLETWWSIKKIKDK